MPRPKKAEAKVEEKVDMEVEENSEENEVEEAPKAAKGKRGRPAKNPRDKLPRGAKTDAAKKIAESDEDDIEDEPKPSKKAGSKKPATSGRGRGRPPKKAQGKPVETPEEADDDEEDEEAKPAKKQTADPVLLVHQKRGKRDLDKLRKLWFDFLIQHKATKEQACSQSIHSLASDFAREMHQPIGCSSYTNLLRKLALEFFNCHYMNPRKENEPAWPTGYV